MFGVVQDGSIFSSFKIEQGRLVRKRVQPSRGHILDFNQELRKNEDALRPLSSMGLELSIPEIDWHWLKLKYPALASSDGKERTEMWRKLLRTRVLDPYRVRDRSRKRGT